MIEPRKTTAPPRQRVPDKLLQPWCKKEIQSFKRYISHFTKSASKQYLFVLSHFFKFCQNQNIKSLKDIPYKIFVEYPRTIKKFDLPAFRKIACFISEKTGKPYLHEITKSAFNKKIFYLDKSKILECKATNSLDELHKAIDSILQYMEENHYSLSVKNFTKLFKIEASIFLLVNNLEYSFDILFYWCNKLKKNNKNHFITYRKLIFDVEEVLNGNSAEEFKEKEFYSNLPGWCGDVLKKYLYIKKQDRYSKSAINQFKHCATKFLNFLNLKGITSFSDISPLIIKEFSIYDIHKTPAGKNAVSSRVRDFLKWLQEYNYISSPLYLSIPKVANKKSLIPKILSCEQDLKLEKFTKEKNHKSCTPLRDIALVKIMRYMGLRASDAVFLKFSSIDFKLQKVKLIQTKTGHVLNLPIPTGVLNSIVEYIKFERPKGTPKTDYIFVSSKAPFFPCKNPCVAIRAVYKCLGLNSSHILRATFASELMKNQNTSILISNALGHTDLNTVNKYLNTDEQRMSDCTLPLSDIEYTGVLF